MQHLAARHRLAHRPDEMGCQRVGSAALDGRPGPVSVRNQRVDTHTRPARGGYGYTRRDDPVQASPGQGSDVERPQGGLYSIAQDFCARQQGERHKERDPRREVRLADSRLDNPHDSSGQGLYLQARTLHARPALGIRVGQAHKPAQHGRRPQHRHQGISRVPGLFVQVRAHKEQDHHHSGGICRYGRALPPDDRGVQLRRGVCGRLLHRLSEPLHASRRHVAAHAVRDFRRSLHAGGRERPCPRDARPLRTGDGALSDRGDSPRLLRQRLHGRKRRSGLLQARTAREGARPCRQAGAGAAPYRILLPRLL